MRPMLINAVISFFEEILRIAPKPLATHAVATTTSTAELLSRAVIRQ
jgi:hypothetical protein